MRASILSIVIFYIVQSSAIYQPAIPALQGFMDYFESTEFQALLDDRKLAIISEISHFIDTTRNNILMTNAADGIIAQNLESKNVKIYEPINHRYPNRSFGVGVDRDSFELDDGEIYPADCMEIMRNGQNKSGIYTIRPNLSGKPFQVRCDMTTQGGGWTHIQRRIDGHINFERNWSDYKFGFGYLDEDHEFWMGLKNIQALTGQEAKELLIEITDRDGLKAYAFYKNFAIGKEQQSYPLSILSGYSGDAGDALSPHLGFKFSTPDFDNTNCAATLKSGWWFHHCFSANLNGKFTNIELTNDYMHMGIHWGTFKSLEYCHSQARMLVRPVQL